MKIQIGTKSGYCFLLIGFLGLMGCVVSQPEPGQVLVRSVACYPEKQDTRASMLTQKGVRVDELGDHVFLTFPLSYVFSPPSSTAVKSGFSTTAALIADFLRCYNRTTNIVTVYNDVLPTNAQNQALSQEQAQGIMDILWDNGMNDDVMVASGSGQSTAQDKAGAQRVSIKAVLRETAE